MRELQERMLQTIFGPLPPTDPALLLYRESIHSSLQETLDLLYSVTRGAYEKTCQNPPWEELGERFISQNWPRDIRLNWAFKNFSEWLPAEPWMKELADYEWSRFLASSARDAQLEDWINPSLVLRAYEYRIPHWFRRREEGVQDDLPQMVFSTVAIFRDPYNDQVRTLEFQPAAIELLSQWLEGGAPEISAQTLAKQLNRPVEEMMLQLDPLLRKMTEEGVLLQASRKNTRYFVR